MHGLQKLIGKTITGTEPLKVRGGMRFHFGDDMFLDVTPGEATAYRLQSRAADHPRRWGTYEDAKAEGI